MFLGRGQHDKFDFLLNLVANLQGAQRNTNNLRKIVKIAIGSARQPNISGNHYYIQQTYSHEACGVVNLQSSDVVPPLLLNFAL